MKKYFGFVASLVVTIGLTYALNQPIKTSSQTLPPLGKLLNPFTGFWQNAESTCCYACTMDSAPISLDGLDGAAEVIYDDRLVPHIFAGSTKDAMKILGYVHAQHRLWQMDISVRATEGSLAEIMGENVLQRDKTQRRKGMGYAAERSLAAWKKDAKSFALIEAYRDGVNEYIDKLSPADYPVEYKLLNYKPESWTVYKTAVFVKSMAATLCFAEDDVEATNAIQEFGKETFDYLYPNYNPKQSPIIPEGTEWNFEPIEPLTFEGDAYPTIGDLSGKPWDNPDPGIGSNNWAVSGSKTKSGNPILCNDPHLSLSLPSIWYEAHINTPEINSYGVTLPGVPGIIIGFNDHVAWGQTNVGQDVTDWYRIEWANNAKTKYILDGKEVPVEWRVEEIKVKGGKTITDSVRYTKWGPVVYEDDKSWSGLALRWLAHNQHSPKELETFTGLNMAKDYDDYSEALTKYVSPAQNFVFASTEGDIALKVNGKLPVKRYDQGRFVQDGSTSQSDWSGFIPMDQVAQVKNPERGFVSSANQHSTSPEYPYFYNAPFDDYRGRILNEKLAGMNDITVEDMMALQNNNESLKAREALPLLLKYLSVENLNTEQKEIVATLKGWKFNYDKDLQTPIYFQEWFRAFYKSVWDEVYTVNEEKPMLFPESWKTIELLESDTTSVFFDQIDTEKKETISDVVNMSFEQMTEKVSELMKDNEDITWHEYNKVNIAHIGRIKPFGSKVLEMGGIGDALNAARGGFGPSWRMIVELGEEINAYGVYPGGQSGNPGSQYYDSMVQDWSKGEYHKLHFVKEKGALEDVSIFNQKFQ